MSAIDPIKVLRERVDYLDRLLAEYRLQVQQLENDRIKQAETERAALVMAIGILELYDAQRK
jgi:hypothetical protein